MKVRTWRNGLISKKSYLSSLIKWLYTNRPSSKILVKTVLFLWLLVTPRPSTRSTFLRAV